MAGIILLAQVAYAKEWLMQKTTKSPTDFLPGGMNKDEATAFLRKVMGPPAREIKGLERDQVLTMLALLEPTHALNNQRYWTDVYQVGKIRYNVTSGVDWGDEDPMVQEYIENE